MKFNTKPTNLAILNNGKVIGRMTVTLATVSQFFPMKAGQPVIGPNIRRLLTIKELQANNSGLSRNKAGDMLRDTPELCLEPLPEIAVAA